MKQGKTLTQLAQEIERQAANRRDYRADTRLVEMTGSGELRCDEFGVLPVNGTAHDQIGGRLGIPAKYYDRMLAQSPELLATNVNHWFRTKPETRLIRTLDGRVRAFLSNRYQRIDNNRVAEAVIPILADVPGIEFVSAEITESRMYLKAVTSAVQGTVVGSIRKGDFVRAGVLIENSEIGLGALHVKPFADFCVCNNGMVRDELRRRFNHVGRVARIIDEDEAVELSDETKHLEDLTVLSKVRDVVKAALDEVKFREFLGKLGETTQQRIEGDPAKSIEVLADTFAMTGDERGSVLRHLIEGGDLSRYGVINAVTRTAEDLPSYDRATQFETFGGDLLALPRREWDAIATAR